MFIFIPFSYTEITYSLSPLTDVSMRVG